MAGKPHDHPHVEGQLSFLDEAATAAVPSAAPSEPPAPDAEDATISGPNTRVRAGNAMHRAREAAVQGALDSIARGGIRGMTMVEAADRGGMARATLYNHVRDKEDLLELVLDHETGTIARAFVAAPNLRAALEGAAAAVAEHPALVGVRAHDQATIGALSAPSDPHLRRLVADALHARGAKASEADADLLLRWLASFIATPSDADTRSVQAAALAKLLA